MLGYTGPPGGPSAHDPNTDKYLDTQVTNVLYVDNKRTDTYTPAGSLTKPFKTIQAALDAVSGNTDTNRFEIRILQGAYYSEAVNVNKSQVALVGDGFARITGAITISAANVRFSRLFIRGTVTCSLANHFSIEVDHCNVAVGAWSITATDPQGDENFQIYGGVFASNLLLTGLGGVSGWDEPGTFQSATLTADNCANFLAVGMMFRSATLNFSNGTSARIAACDAQNSTCTLLTGANLIGDATAADSLTITESGGTFSGTTRASHIVNDSFLEGATVKDALENLAQQFEIGSVAGEDLQAGQPVFANTADGLLYKASASLDEASKVCGLIKRDTPQGHPCILVPNGGLTLTDWTVPVGAVHLAAGASYYLSNTAGQLTTVPPVAGYVVRVAVAVTSTVLDVDIQTRVRI